MPGFRAERIAEMIHKELASRLLLEVKDPRVGPISITSIDVTKDLSRARVSYLPLGGGEASDELKEGLEAAARQLRGPIGRALRLRHAPELVFVFDEHHAKAVAVTQLLDQLSREREDRADEEES
jgi:ribosome-binding factor A